MKKIAPYDPEAKSADLVAAIIDQLKALFPEAFVEGKVDFEVLKQLLGGAVDERDEKYYAVRLIMPSRSLNRLHGLPATFGGNYAKPMVGPPASFPA